MNRIPLPRIDDPVPNAPFPTPGQGIVLGLTGSLDPSVKVPGSSLVAPVAGSLLSGSVQGSLLTGTVAGSLLTGSVAGSLLTGSVAGSLLTGTVAGSLLTGTVASSLLTGALPAAILATLPGYEIAYQAYSSDQTTTSTTLTDLFTFSAATFDAVKYYLEIVIPNLRHSGANQSIQFQLMESATPVGSIVQFETQNVAGQGISCFARIPFTPTAAAHTYKVQWKTASAGTATIKAAGGGDATFRITRA